MKFFSTKWSQFCKKYSFDSNFGYLIDSFTEKKSLQQSKIQQILNKLSSFKTSEQLSKQIKLIQIIDISSLREENDKIILRDSLTFILGKFLAIQRENKKDEEIQVPFPLSKLLIDASKQLGVKIGPTAALSSNWFQTKTILKKKDSNFEGQNKHENPQCFKEQTKDGLRMDQFQLKYYYTQNHEQQKAFFGTSIAASSHIASIIKYCYEINQTIENQKISQNQKNKIIQGKLIEIEQKWNIVYELMKECSQNLQPEFFYYQIRKYIAGFNNLKFQNYEGNFTSGGGSTGQDPTYQIFQRAMGISLEQTFQKVQQKLRQGMYHCHLRMNYHFNKYSKIKSYCSEHSHLLEQYENVLKSYTKVNCYHNVFIRKYILRFVQADKQIQTYGTGGNKITNVMSRWRVLDKQNGLGMLSDSLPERPTEKIENKADNGDDKNNLGSKTESWIILQDRKTTKNM